MERQTLLTGPGQLHLAEVSARTPGSTELVIRPDAVGICGTDLELLAGTMAYLADGFARYPLVPGHEWTGIVTAVGAEVAGLSLGDRVVGECSIGCGCCTRCAEGAYHLCPRRRETGIVGQDGALATTLVFPAAAAHRVPKTVPREDAALVEPLAVAYRALRRVGVGPDDALGVVGAGTIGLLCALTARALGVAAVHVLEADPARRRRAAALNLSVVSEPDGRLPRVVDASGTPAGASAALRLCSEGGTVGLVGLTGSDATAVDLDSIVVRDITLHGCLGSPHVWPDVIELVAQGAVRPSVLVTHRFPLEDVAAAFELAARRDVGLGKILVTPNG